MKRTLLLTVLIFLLTISGCSNKSVPKTGEYITDDKMNHVFLEKNGNFSVVVTGRSYTPNGVYEIKDKLILTIDNDNEFVFTFKNDTLVFESGEWLESVVEKGTEFHLIAENE